MQGPFNGTPAMPTPYIHNLRVGAVASDLALRQHGAVVEAVLLAHKKKEKKKNRVKVLPFLLLLQDPCPFWFYMYMHVYRYHLTHIYANTPTIGSFVVCIHTYV